MALPGLLPVPPFPTPEGPHVVGTVTFVREDPTREDAEARGRPRRLPAQAFYLADPGALALAGKPPWGAPSGIR